jgi:DNA repair ATPase RecN
MKKCLIGFMLIIGFAQHSFAQADEIAQLALNIEKLAQLKKILTNLKDGYQIVSKGYSTIKDISEGNFNIHQAFLDGLLKVSPTVKNYKRVAEIIDCQLKLVKEYKNAKRRFEADGNFSPNELEYIGKVYSNLFKESIRNLDDLTSVVTANKLRMSDDERLQTIDRINIEMEDKLFFLRDFNNNTRQLAVQRTKEKNDIAAMQKLHGIKD